MRGPSRLHRPPWVEPPSDEISQNPDVANFACPNCGALLAFAPGEQYIGTHGRASRAVWLAQQKCANSDCQVQILHRQEVDTPSTDRVESGWELVYPRRLPRPPADPAVPDEIRQDYGEACLVLADSPKSSAALARRCLQAVLQSLVGKKSSLVKEIDEAANQLPADLISDLHALRQLGNFAAHPTKDTATGTIVDVEPGEAEWTLDLVGSLLDHVYVAPKQRAAMRASLNAKLASAGKPSLP
jgi:Domain of unknown function (DUF4145)